jgi:hypothetical protein
MEASSCNRGTYIADALDLLVSQGVVSAATIPYTDSQCIVPSSGGPFKIDGYQLASVSDLKSIKDHLFYTRSPIPIGIGVYNDFMSFSGSGID